MQTVALKIANHEAKYLENIAQEMNLLKNEGQEFSLGKALKELLRWCTYNKIDISKKQNGLDDDLRKMMSKFIYLFRISCIIPEFNH